MHAGVTSQREQVAVSVGVKLRSLRTQVGCRRKGTLLQRRRKGHRRQNLLVVPADRKNCRLPRKSIDVEVFVN